MLMAARKILFLVGDFAKDYEVMVPHPGPAKKAQGVTLEELADNHDRSITKRRGR
jgi:hypothetical protein